MHADRDVEQADLPIRPPDDSRKGYQFPGTIKAVNQKEYVQKSRVSVRMLTAAGSTRNAKVIRQFDIRL
jgi:hypothetical protein